MRSHSTQTYRIPVDKGVHKAWGIFVAGKIRREKRTGAWIDRLPDTSPAFGNPARSEGILKFEIRNSRVSRTSVGFATPAHAGCAFIASGKHLQISIRQGG
jgi:hypothetical protein